MPFSPFDKFDVISRCTRREPYRECELDDQPPSPSPLPPTTKTSQTSSKKSKKKKSSSSSSSTIFSTPIKKKLNNKSSPNSYLQANATAISAASPLLITPSDSSSSSSSTIRISRSSSSSSDDSNSVSSTSNGNGSIKRSSLSFASKSSPITKSRRRNIPPIPPQTPNSNNKIRRKLSYIINDDGIMTNSNNNSSSLLSTPQKKYRCTPESKIFNSPPQNISRVTSSDQKRKKRDCKDHDILSPYTKTLITPNRTRTRTITPTIATTIISSSRGEATIHSLEQVEKAVTKTYSKLHQFALQYQISSTSHHNRNIGIKEKTTPLLQSPKVMTIDYDKTKYKSTNQHQSTFSNSPKNIEKKCLNNSPKNIEKQCLKNDKNNDSNTILIQSLQEKISLLEKQIKTHEETIQYQRRENEKLLDLLSAHDQQEQKENLNDHIVMEEQVNVKQFLDCLLNKNVYIDDDYLKSMLWNAYHGSIQSDHKIMYMSEDHDNSIEDISSLNVEDNHNEESSISNAIVVSNSCRNENMIIQPSSTPAFDKIIKLPMQSSSIKKNISKPYNNESNPKINHIDDVTSQEEVEIEVSNAIKNTRKNNRVEEQTIERLQNQIQYLEKSVCVWKDIANDLQYDLLKITDISNSFFVNMLDDVDVTI